LELLTLRTRLSISFSVSFSIKIFGVIILVSSDIATSKGKNKKGKQVQKRY
jgi:hypothetical protein